MFSWVLKINHTKIEAESLNFEILKILSTSLMILTGSSYIKSQRQSTVRETVHSLTESFKRYAEYLDYQNIGMQLRHSQMELRSY